MSNATVGPTLPPFTYAGARAMVLLHEQHLRRFLETWKKAKKGGLELPPIEDPDYASLEHLLRHVLLAASGYMYWMCEALGLPAPEIEPPPTIEKIEASAESYLEHLLERWRKPLAKVSEGECFQPEYAVPWGVHYCIDAMLEHAVMHPIRHDFQLREMLDELRQTRPSL